MAFNTLSAQRTLIKLKLDPLETAVNNALLIIESAEGFILPLAKLRQELDSYSGPQFDPAIEKWQDDSGWRKLFFTIVPGTPSMKAIRTGVRAISGECWWLGDSPRSTPTITAVSFEYKMIKIKRGSLDSLLSSGAWKWNEGEVSDGGTFQDGKSAEGVFPALATYVLLGRNLEFSYPYQADWLRALYLTAADGKVILAANISMADTLPEKKGVYGPAIFSSGMRLPLPQMLGFGFKVIPKLPSPDPTLKWP